MFAKVFGQIFDSSIAQDYNCRRMFIDLLVLADPTGAVDMTHDAISRRTNVPLEEVQKYITDLCEPDPLSRSQLEQGKRLVPLDKNRDWGWQIVNYMHYRKLRDEEARRSYFRDASKRYRRKKKQEQEEVEGEEGNQAPSLTVNGASNTSHPPKQEIENFCVSLGLPRSDGEAMLLHWEEKKWPKNWKLTIRKWKSFGYLPSQKKNNKFQPPSRQTEAELWYEKRQRQGI